MRRSAIGSGGARARAAPGDADASARALPRARACVPAPRNGATPVGRSAAIGAPLARAIGPSGKEPTPLRRSKRREREGEGEGVTPSPPNLSPPTSLARAQWQPRPMARRDHRGHRVPHGHRANGAQKGREGGREPVRGAQRQCGAVPWLSLSLSPSPSKRAPAPANPREGPNRRGCKPDASPGSGSRQVAPARRDRAPPRGGVRARRERALGGRERAPKKGEERSSL